MVPRVPSPLPARAVRAGIIGAAAASLALTGTVPASAATSAPTAPPAGNVVTGPSTTKAPYVLPVAGSATITSLLTVGDRPAADGTQLAGIPDGIGLYEKGSTVTALVNHELRPAHGIARAHGQKGAFVSSWTIDPKTLKVTSGRDLIQPGIRYWNYTTGAYAAAPGAPAGAAAGTHTPEFARFCSGFLAPAGSVRSGRLGYEGALYLANEESGQEGRLFAVTTDGQAYQLPRLGLFSWENTIVSEKRNDTTVVIGTEDDAAGQLRIYTGTKQSAGTPVEKAGLTNGSLQVLDTVDESVGTDAQFRAKFGKGRAVPVSFGANERIDWTKNGTAQNAEAAAKGLTLNRIEDGAFDPDNPQDFYFLTTEGGSWQPDPATPSISRDGGGLWKLSFTNIKKPELGGTLTLLLDGTEAPYLNKPDNMTIDTRGNLLIQEDPGGNDHLARIVAYRISDGQLGVVAQFDPARFGVTNPAGTTPDTRAVLTTDEESSGIVDAEKYFGRSTFLFDAQVHTPKNLPAGTGPGTVEEFVENGQLLLLKVKDWNKVYAS